MMDQKDMDKEVLAELNSLAANLRLHEAFKTIRVEEEETEVVDEDNISALLESAFQEEADEVVDKSSLKALLESTSNDTDKEMDKEVLARAFMTLIVEEEATDEVVDKGNRNSLRGSVTNDNTKFSEVTAEQKKALAHNISVWLTNDKLGERATVAEILREKKVSARDDKDAALGTLEACAMQSPVAIARRKTNTASTIRRKPLLATLVMTKKFMLYRHRFMNAQINRTYVFPTLPQPKSDEDLDEDRTTEMTRTRTSHRFIITADTQFGILMDGFNMKFPNWQTEIDISRECVQTINSMKGEKRPLYVCVCGDLIDTEGSFSNALASWKIVMKDWERRVIAERQMKDWKEVWAQLDEDIGLVCLCGNHDVGNRPTAQSIETWTSVFGNDYLAFWVNGTYNIGLNNCVFSDPSGAMDLYEEQLAWLEGRLEYASAKKASQIFVYSHYPWFITHEDEHDLIMTSASLPPKGWGPPDTKFNDYYFNIPLERRKVVLSLFRKHKVKACFSGHFHQNVVSKTDWGMDMIITGPLSMMLKSTDQLSTAEEKQTIGMRIVDVQENSFKHEFVPLEKNIYCADCQEHVAESDENKPKTIVASDQLEIDSDHKRSCSEKCKCATM